MHMTLNEDWLEDKSDGVAERMNRTIVEKAKCMLFDADFSLDYWAEAVDTSVYIINRSYTSLLKNNITPEEMWTGVKPDVSKFRIFGCDVMMHVPKQKRKKWSPKSVPMKFVGYADGTKGYRLIDFSTKKIVKSRDVVFMQKRVKWAIMTSLNTVTHSAKTRLHFPSKIQEIQIMFLKMTKLEINP